MASRSPAAERAGRAGQDRPRRPGAATRRGHDDGARPAPTSSGPRARRGGPARAGTPGCPADATSMPASTHSSTPDSIRARDGLERWPRRRGPPPTRAPEHRWPPAERRLARARHGIPDRRRQLVAAGGDDLGHEEGVAARREVERCAVDAGAVHQRGTAAGDSGGRLIVTLLVGGTSPSAMRKGWPAPTSSSR